MNSTGLHNNGATNTVGTGHAGAYNDTKVNRRGTGDSGFKYHPILFTLLALTALAEIAITASLINSHRKTFYPSSHYRSGLLFLIVVAVWTFIWATMHAITSMTRSNNAMGKIRTAVISLIITAILWGIATGIFTRARPGTCLVFLTNSLCHRSIASEALGWTAFTLTVLTLLASLHHAGIANRGYGSGYYA